MKHEIIKDLNSSIVLIDGMGEYLPLTQHDKEVEALRAQVEQLQNQVKIPATSDEAAAMALTGMNWLENNDKSKLTEFHNKYVAEIKAQAFKQGFEACIDAAIDFGYLENDAYQCAQLRQQANGEL